MDLDRMEMIFRGMRNDFRQCEYTSTRRNTRFPDREGEKKAGPVIQQARSRKRYTGVTTRASVQLENFFFDLPSPSPQLFYARCFHPRAIYGPSERHSLRPSPVL